MHAVSCDINFLRYEYEWHLARTYGCQKVNGLFRGSREASYATCSATVSRTLHNCQMVKFGHGVTNL